MLVKVRDRKRPEIVRTVTQKAYAAMGPKVYEKLGFVNDDGSEIEGSPNSKAPQVQQVSRSVKSAGPVVVKTQLVAKAPQPVNEPEPKQEDPAPAADEPVKERRKPGPKPKTQPAQESISSNSTADEQ